MGKCTPSSNRRKNHALWRAAFEPLEERRLMSLLGVVPSYPQIQTNQTGALTYSYNSTTSVGSFDLSSTPFTFKQSSSGTQMLVLNSSAVPSTFQIHFKTNSSGAVTGGVSGADFTIAGTVDLNNDFKVDTGDISGTLLTGEIAAFGYLATGPTTSQYDFIFVPTGGLLLTNYPSQFQNMNIGVTMTSENSTFTGDFSKNFSGAVKAQEGPVSLYKPTIATIASITNGGVVGGSLLSDAAALSGGYNPTGSVTFSLTKPDGSTVTVGSSNVTGDGNYHSPTYTADEVGTYTWHASYSGDSLNSSAVDNGANESVTSIKASPAIVTQASAATNVVGSAMLADTATISGGYNVDGTIDFTLTKPDGQTVDLGTVAVSGDGNYSSPQVLADEVGTYTWHASYSGNSLNNGAIDDGANESITTIKATPAIVTVAQPSSTVDAGASLSDQAILSGGYNVSGGTISFFVTAPDGSIINVGSVNVTGDGTYTSGTITANQVGTYVWAATYSGDSLNFGATDNGNNEATSSSKASPAISTVATQSGNFVGAAILRDSAIVTGGYDVTGSITFTLLQPDGSIVTVGTVNVNGDATYDSPTVVATEVGTYTWHASYGGDALNNSADDNGSNESLSTSETSPSVSTQAVESSNLVGSAMLSDSAVLSGGYSDSGTIAFAVTQPDGSIVSLGSVSVSGDGTYYSSSVLATQVGTYTFHASYSGDSLNNGAIDDGTNESVTTVQVNPTLVTNHAQKPGGAIMLGDGQTLSDIGDLEGGYNPTGTITFYLYSPDNVQVGSEVVTVNGDGHYYTTGNYVPTEAGTYHWQAFYSGDANNAPANDIDGNESQDVAPATPVISTVAGSSVVVGSGNRLTDTAHLTGGYNESGTITFTLSDANQNVLDTETVNVNGDGSYSTPTGYLPTNVGTDTWSATYNGDNNNLTATDDGTNEAETVLKASPNIVTTASETGNVVGSASISDSAVVSGSYNASGSIVFTLIAPNGATVSTQTIPINGNGTYSTASVTATQVGTYTWHASYVGDSLNNGAVDQGGASEQAAVIAATPSIVTTPGASFLLGSGSKLSDSATLSGGYMPSGTITFILYAPDKTTVLYTDKVAISGDGTYSTAAGSNPGGYLPNAAGTYYWIACYGGDTNNIKASDKIGDETEVVIAPATISGTVFCDTNLNGVRDAGEGVENGAAVSLLSGSSVIATTTSNTSGAYSFSGIAPGTYTVKITAANSGDVIEASHGTVTVNSSYSVTVGAGATSSGNNFAEVDLGSISGTVFIDMNDDGTFETGDTAVAGATITLTGKDYTGATVTKTVTSSSNGVFSVTGLLPSDSNGYTATLSVPNGYVIGNSTPGTLNGNTDGTDTADGVVSQIVLPGCNNNAVNYQYGVHGILHGLTATIGFWHNKNGQALINSFGTTSTGLTLANWLATNMPNLFGKNAPGWNVKSITGTNLTGRSNSDVANYFNTLFSVTGNKAYAQVLATAFACFTTSTAYNTGATGQALATKYGFILSSGGTAYATFTVAQTDWAAFGITSSSGATKTIGQLLLLVNQYAVKGVLDSGTLSLITESSDTFNSINNLGDITA